MTYQIEIVERQEQPAAVVRGHADTAHIAEFMGKAFGEVVAVVNHEHLTFAGAPFGRYTPTGDGSFDIEAGFPVDGPAAPEGNVEIVALPGGLAVRTLHVGPYAGVAAAYEAAGKWLRDNRYVVTGAPWETYLDGPEVANPRTEVYFPVRTA